MREQLLRPAELRGQRDPPRRAGRTIASHGVRVPQSGDELTLADLAGVAKGFGSASSEVQFGVFTSGIDGVDARLVALAKFDQIQRTAVAITEWSVATC